MGRTVTFCEAPVISMTVPRPRGSGCCSPDCAPGCPVCVRLWGWWWLLLPHPERRCPHRVPPAAGKPGGGRGRAGGLPRPLRHPSGGRAVGDSSALTAQGVVVGVGGGAAAGRLDLQDRKWTAASPTPAPWASWGYLEPVSWEFCEQLVSVGQRETGEFLLLNDYFLSPLLHPNTGNFLSSPHMLFIPTIAASWRNPLHLVTPEHCWDDPTSPVLTASSPQSLC
ncbi:transgelin-2 isoform X1 [Papio anubis]|uniref:transgelin-2 isoform X1 n=1 Tax=Papio anubis TaxID=9555 RepID=UPI0012AE0F67|nr:transgelin-2 isoform X1 [Papio anubis]